MLNSEKKIKLLIFITCLCLYIVFWNGIQVSVDGIVMFQYAKSLLFNRSVVMEPPVLWGIEFSVSRWPIGLTLAYIPFLALFSLIPGIRSPQFFIYPYDPAIDFNSAYFNDYAYQFASLIQPMVTALTAVLVFSLGIEIGLSRKKSILAALIFGLASPAAVYTRFDYSQPLASFLMLASVVWLLRARNGKKTGLVLAGFLVGLSGMTRLEMLIIPGGLICLAAFLIPFRFESELKNKILEGFRNLALVVLPMSFGVINILIWNELRFGSWSSSGYWGRINSFVLDPVRNLTALLANLISPGRGIFIFFPLSILAVLGLFLLIRKDWWVGGLMNGIVIGSWLMYSTWYQWGAGVSWGPRFFIPLIPYLCVLSWFGWEGFTRFSRKVRIWLWSLLVALGAIASLQGLIFNPLDFYSLANLTDRMIGDGYYHFKFSMSPIFAGWDFLFDTVRYEIIWFRLTREQPLWILGFYLFLAITILLGLIWYKWFKGFAITSVWDEKEFN